MGATESNGIPGRPTYARADFWTAFPRFSSAPNQSPETNYGTGLGVGVGSFELNPAGSPGLSAGQALPNFSYDIDNLPLARRSGVELHTGLCDSTHNAGCPDVGAHDSASAETMKFGLSAGQ